MIKIGFFTFFLIILAGCGDITDHSFDKNNDDSLSTTETTGTKNQVQLNNEAVKENEEHSSTKNDKDEPNDSRRIIGKVTYVVDGDTFDVKLKNGRTERVRLILIDTPETKHPDKPVQPFGQEASEFTKKQLLGKTVELELDVQERDRYGRILAYAYVNGEMINKKLLEKGYARVAIFPPNTKYVDEFREIQKKAQKKRLGIWSIENYVGEEGFQQANVKNNRSSTKSNQCANPKIKGNINSRGEKIYHVPGGQFYEQTKAEKLFCTEKEAVEAGYRKSKR